MIKNKSEIKDLLNEKEFEQGFVIKPNDETEGKGIFIFNKNSKNIPQIRKEEILQQRIIPNLRKGKYWDVRVFVINGKYCGGFIRESKSRITNISKGAKAKKITPDIAKILKKPAERATKAIEKYCQKK